LYKLDRIEITLSIS